MNSPLVVNNAEEKQDKRHKGKGDTAEQNGSLQKEQLESPNSAEIQIEDMELREEWQDEEFPKPLPEDNDALIEDDLNANAEVNRPVAPKSLQLYGNKKRLLAPAISLNLEGNEEVTRSEERTPDELEGDSCDINVDDLETPSDSESFELPENGNDFEWEDDLPRVFRSLSDTDSFQGHVTDEETEDGKLWRVFHIGEQEYRVDMAVVDPYKAVISHGGCFGENLTAIILFSSCYLPESSRPDYENVMENLFRYVIGTLELLVAENYIIVYLNGATTRNRVPSISWLKQCYQTIDRRLRKNLKSLIVVHPSWFIKVILAITRPFISTKFSRKVRFVSSLQELSKLIPMQHVHIPECIKELDEELNGNSET
ncbi:bcl-2/adenovirus E1B 19 kDa-interacting protein 2-like protein isoform X2 [Leucoraja erinacea]|uniref:bcl-2/adenovirus E1B 19 kDa-interacting protein 2-like protein isoform X2 n=1 Tax=Leucoraja erinaceus TaxID=7782 RepID=UPI002457A8F0|nr:bcl-2/adenovirus E1B 19 kDa-interacting protein 2-like protein isoform X2 [Leucoraja erinacea]